MCTDISHLHVKTKKNYVDAIARWLRQLENEQHDLSERYGQGVIGRKTSTSLCESNDR